jgi:hypothetical protein
LAAASRHTLAAVQAFIADAALWFGLNPAEKRRV